MADTNKTGSDVVSTNGRFNNIWVSSLRGLHNRALYHFFSVLTEKMQINFREPPLTISISA